MISHLSESPLRKPSMLETKGSEVMVTPRYNSDDRSATPKDTVLTQPAPTIFQRGFRWNEFNVVHKFVEFFGGTREPDDSPGLSTSQLDQRVVTRDLVQVSKTKFRHQQVLPQMCINSVDTPLLRRVLPSLFGVSLPIRQPRSTLLQVSLPDLTFLAQMPSLPSRGLHNILDYCAPIDAIGGKASLFSCRLPPLLAIAVQEGGTADQLSQVIEDPENYVILHLMPFFADRASDSTISAAAELQPDRRYPDGVGAFHYTSFDQAVSFDYMHFHAYMIPGVKGFYLPGQEAIFVEAVSVIHTHCGARYVLTQFTKIYGCDQPLLSCSRGYFSPKSQQNAFTATNWQYTSLAELLDPSSLALYKTTVSAADCIFGAIIVIWGSDTGPPQLSHEDEITRWVYVFETMSDSFPCVSFDAKYLQLANLDPYRATSNSILGSGQINHLEHLSQHQNLVALAIARGKIEGGVLSTTWSLQAHYPDGKSVIQPVLVNNGLSSRDLSLTSAEIAVHNRLTAPSVLSERTVEEMYVGEVYQNFYDCYLHCIRKTSEKKTYHGLTETQYEHAVDSLHSQRMKYWIDRTGFPDFGPQYKKEEEEFIAEDNVEIHYPYSRPGSAASLDYLIRYQVTSKAQVKEERHKIAKPERIYVATSPWANLLLTELTGKTVLMALPACGVGRKTRDLERFALSMMKVLSYTAHYDNHLEESPHPYQPEDHEHHVQKFNDTFHYSVDGKNITAKSALKGFEHNVERNFHALIHFCRRTHNPLIMVGVDKSACDVTVSGFSRERVLEMLDPDTSRERLGEIMKNLRPYSAYFLLNRQLLNDNDKDGIARVRNAIIVLLDSMDDLNVGIRDPSGNYTKLFLKCAKHVCSGTRFATTEPTTLACIMVSIATYSELLIHWKSKHPDFFAFMIRQVEPLGAQEEAIRSLAVSMALTLTISSGDDNITMLPAKWNDLTREYHPTDMALKIVKDVHAKFGMKGDIEGYRTSLSPKGLTMCSMFLSKAVGGFFHRDLGYGTFAMHDVAKVADSLITLSRKPEMTFIFLCKIMAYFHLYDPAPDTVIFRYLSNVSNYVAVLASNDERFCVDVEMAITDQTAEDLLDWKYVNIHGINSGDLTKFLRSVQAIICEEQSIDGRWNDISLFKFGDMYLQCRTSHKDICCPHYISVENEWAALEFLFKQYPGLEQDVLAKTEEDFNFQMAAKVQKAVFEDTQFDIVHTEKSVAINLPTVKIPKQVEKKDKSAPSLENTSPPGGYVTPEEQTATGARVSTSANAAGTIEFNDECIFFNCMYCHQDRVGHSPYECPENPENLKVAATSGTITPDQKTSGVPNITVLHTPVSVPSGKISPDGSHPKYRTQTQVLIDIRDKLKVVQENLVCRICGDVLTDKVHMCRKDPCDNPSEKPICIEMVVPLLIVATSMKEFVSKFVLSMNLRFNKNNIHNGYTVDVDWRTIDIQRKLCTALQIIIRDPNGQSVKGGWKQNDRVPQVVYELLPSLVFAMCYALNQIDKTSATAEAISMTLLLGIMLRSGKWQAGVLSKHVSEMNWDVISKQEAAKSGGKQRVSWYYGFPDRLLLNGAYTLKPRKTGKKSGKKTKSHKDAPKTGGSGASGVVRNEKNEEKDEESDPGVWPPGSTSSK